MKDAVKNLQLGEEGLLIMRKSLSLPKEDTFGIEIEAVKKERLDFRTLFLGTRYHWHYTSDSTLYPPCGGEFVSPIYRDQPDTWTQIARECTVLKEAGLYVNHSCAGHIHIGTQILNGVPGAFINLLKLWAVYEDVIFQFSRGQFSNYRRLLRLYGRPISHLIQENLDQKLITSMDDIHHSQLSLAKRYALDFSYMKGLGQKRGNTIEVRCPNGTLEPAIWQNMINFFLKLFHYAASPSFARTFPFERYHELSQKPLVQADYENANEEKAKELCDCIFSDPVDRYYFWKQYQKAPMAKTDLPVLVKTKPFWK